MFIRDLIIEKRFINCNINDIPIKFGLLIEMGDLEDYKENRSMDISMNDR